VHWVIRNGRRRRPDRAKYPSFCATWPSPVASSEPRRWIYSASLFTGSAELRKLNRRIVMRLFGYFPASSADLAVAPAGRGWDESHTFKVAGDLKAEGRGCHGECQSTAAGSCVRSPPIGRVCRWHEASGRGDQRRDMC
jgi:hypothetical protein